MEQEQGLPEKRAHSDNYSVGVYPSIEEFRILLDKSSKEQPKAKSEIIARLSALVYIMVLADAPDVKQYAEAFLVSQH